ncbi:hypothetical protein GGS26DRAFT_399900 [Hypomontagnella submonticulosa]|nr:hypothetical protein GGS26DRAFT_399900 [Hypomontagnella submonticulosa]
MLLFFSLSIIHRIRTRVPPSRQIKTVPLLRACAFQPGIGSGSSHFPSNCYRRIHRYELRSQVTVNRVYVARHRGSDPNGPYMYTINDSITKPYQDLVL